MTQRLKKWPAPSWVSPASPFQIPIETACQDQKSNFFHLLFSVKPKTPEKATEDWKQLAEASLENYIWEFAPEDILGYVGI